MSKIKEFVKQHKLNKSYDYRDHYVIIDSQDQKNAEQDVPETMLKFTKECISNQKEHQESVIDNQGIYKVWFMKGCLTMAQKAENLYNCQFEDSEGQVVEKLSDVTMEIALKTLMVKGFISKEEFEPQPKAEVAEPVIEAPINPNPNPMTVRVKYGDFEFEMRKSVKNFVSDFKKARSLIPSDELKKAIRSWRKGAKYNDFTSDLEAAKFILDNWEQEKEGFNQTLFAVQQKRK